METLRAKKEWTIYKITNPEGGIYIGKTSNFSSRIKRYKYHCPDVRKQRGLSESLKKHGFNSHKIDVLEKFSSDEGFANGKEIFWIRSNMCNVNKWPEMKGLNLSDGGRGSRGFRHSQEEKNKRSIWATGRKQSEETKKKKNEKLRSVKKTEAQIMKTTLANRKPILQFDLQGNLIKEHLSVKHAMFEMTGKWGRQAYICQHLTGKRPAYKGFIFKYKNPI